MKKLNYILFEDDQNNICLGFNKHKSPGYIDCGSGWSERALEKFEENILSELPIWLKMFSGKNSPELSIDRIVDVLSKGKKIICLMEDEPIEISLNEKQEVQITKIENYKYVLK